MTDGGQLTPSPRVGDEDRGQVVDLLRVHTSEGRLTLDEFSERVGMALAATTRADLDAVVSDLPTQSAPIPDTRRRRATRWVVAVMSGAARKGRWRTGSSVTAVAVMGGAELDFRQAEIDAPEVVVTAVAVMGGIDIVVPEGIEVELTGMPIMGGKHMRLADVPILPGSPRIVVRAFPIMGGVTVRSRPDRARKRDRVETDSGMPAGRALPAGGPNPLAAFDIDQVMERANRHVARQMERAERHMRRAQQWGVGLPPERPGPPERVADVTPPAPPPPTPPVPAPDPVVAPAAAAGAPAEEHDLPTDAELAAVPTAPDGTVTIMFTDIVGFTQTTERIGDRATRDLVHRYQQIVRGQLAAYGGYEVKVQGDGFMVAFAGASRALRCAIAIERAFDDYNKDDPPEPIRLHQGLHTGEAVRDRGDFLGRTVIVASRLAGVAGSGEILVSSMVRELADSNREFRFGEARETQLKGLAGPQTVYPVEWRA